MRQLSLTLKIIIIFLVPTVAMVYFSFYFTYERYEQLQDSKKYKLSAQITKSLSNLVHNIQRERGLSAGYIVSNEKSKLSKELFEQYASTDLSYKIILQCYHDRNEIKDKIDQELGTKNSKLLIHVIQRFKNLQSIREKVLHSQINFNDEITFYTEINQELIKYIDSFVIILRKQRNDYIALSKIQKIKECAGLERAYIYHQAIANKTDQNFQEKIQYFQEQQKQHKEEFLLYASMSATIIYTDILTQKVTQKIYTLRQYHLKNSLTHKDALEWFSISTQRINMLEEILDEIIDEYVEYAETIHEQAISKLYTTAILWFFTLISLTILIYYLRKIIKKEEENLETLKIAAYTFDSHEAITITDVEGTMLKVNKGFTRITGYSSEEVIGENPRILKSMRHNNDFYKDMWEKINTKGKWAGDIYNKRKNGEIYLERLSITAIKDENNITTNYIAQFLDISDIKKAQEKAEHQADHDFLTGLANRKYLMTRLNQEYTKAKRHDFLHAFLFIDLDNFKRINDSFGHNIGDLLIREVASRLNSILREEDLCARISGDEFAILIPNIDKSAHHAAQILKKISTKILNKIEQPFLIQNQELHISSSVGIKLFPDEEKDAEDVVIHADTAMYQAKKQGKNQFVFFDKEIEESLKQLSLLEEEINNGLKNNEFKLYYQAKIDVKSNTICGAELLSRWEHPTRGLLYPDSFIETAKEIGVIAKFTTLALQTACQFLKEYGAQFKGSLALNITAKELLHPNFSKELIETVEKYNIDPSKLELEITEDDIIKDFNSAVLKIQHLQEFGIKFSIDDFGTGYSSITYLKKLPADTLKIDRSFLYTLDESSKALVKMIINMAKVFHMKVVAEGIETQEHLDFIKENNVESYQGYFFSKAIEKKEFLKLLQNQLK